MEKLINYAVNMMIAENQDPYDNPTQNPDLHPSQNVDINTSQNPDINMTQNPDLHPSQNREWKKAWWTKFKELSLWDHMNKSQQDRCKIFLSRM